MTTLPFARAVGGFQLFLLARAVSWAGSAVTLVALPVLLYQRTGSPALAGLLTTLEAVPYLLLGLPAGALVDRWDQRRTLVATSWLSAITMASIPVATLLGVLTTPQLLIVAVLTSSTFVFFDAAGFGVVPALVGRDGVAGATGTMMTVNTVIGLLGPAAGGLLATAIGAGDALAIDAASYALAGVLLAALHWDAPDHAGPVTRGAATDIVEGLRYLWSHRVIRVLTLLGVGNSLTAGAVTGLIIVTAVRRLGLGDHDARLGLLYTCASLGSLVAGLAISRLQRRLSLGTITLAGLAANLLLLVALAQTTDLGIALAVVAGWQATNTLISLNGIITRQAITPAQLQGRVNTTARMIAWGGQPIGAGLGGLAASHLGVHTALLIATAGVGGSLALGLAGSLRTTGRLAELIPSEAES
jgi:MFS family permease